MQRWIKLPDSRFIDANRVAFIGKVDTFARIDEDGNDLGTEDCTRSMSARIFRASRRSPLSAARTRYLRC